MRTLLWKKSQEDDLRRAKKQQAAQSELIFEQAEAEVSKEECTWHPKDGGLFARSHASVECTQARTLERNT
jgi:hypothetical protein